MKGGRGAATSFTLPPPFMPCSCGGKGRCHLDWHISMAKGSGRWWTGAAAQRLAATAVPAHNLQPCVCARPPQPAEAPGAHVLLTSTSTGLALICRPMRTGMRCTSVPCVTARRSLQPSLRSTVQRGCPLRRGSHSVLRRRRWLVRVSGPAGLGLRAGVCAWLGSPRCAPAKECVYVRART